VVGVGGASVLLKKKAQTFRMGAGHLDIGGRMASTLRPERRGDHGGNILRRREDIGVGHAAPRRVQRQTASLTLPKGGPRFDIEKGS